MATGTDKFLNYNGLVKLIGLIKKRINDAINWKSNVFVKDVVGVHTTNQQASGDANVTFVEQSAVVTLGKLDGTGTDTTHNITFTDARYDPVDPSRGAGLMSVEDKVKLDNLGATGANKGANLVKYDSTAATTSGSVAEAIKNLQGAVGGGDLVKSVDNATQDNYNYNNVNIIPNHPRTGNYTKANNASGTFTYYDTRYGLATANSGSGASVVQGMNGLMSADDKTNLDAIVAAFPDKEISRLVVTVTKSGDVYSADKTPLEISNAINEGRDVVVFYSGTIYNLARVSNPYMFVSSHPNNARLLFFTFNGSTIEHGEVNLVPNTTEINGKALSSNITLKSGDIGLTSNITIDSATTTDVQAALTALNTLAAANKSAISTLQSGGLTREVVTALPTGTSIKTNVIYMILASNDSLNGGDPSTSATTTPYGTNNNSYNEYMYINNAWERIGSTEVNLDIDPITDDEIDTAWSTTVAAA